MRVLLVGAGAVGQVYGRHLQLGGAQLSYYVRPKYLEQLRGGLTLYPLNEGRAARTQGVQLGDYALLSRPDEVAAQQWDQVWLCIPSDALAGPWLAPFLAAIGDATLVALPPGLEDRARLLESAALDEAQLVTGQITFMAWQAPLPGEAASRYPEPGTAYWFAPGSPSNFDGPSPRVEAVVAALRAGQCPARVSASTAAAIHQTVAISLPMMAALELAGWSLRSLRRGPMLATGLAAAREAMVIAARHRGVPVGLGPALLRAWILRPLIALAPLFLPFDLEAFLAWHFSKVGGQTRAALQTYLERAHGEGARLPSEAIAELARRLPELEAGPALAQLAASES